MEYSQKFYLSIIENLFNAIAFRRIITDKNNNPVNCEFVYVNKAFEKMTGLNRDEILGKRVTEVRPEYEKSEFDWIRFYGNMVLKNTCESIHQYVEPYKKWFSINAYPTGEGYFITIFNDITEIKLKEMELEADNEELSSLYEELTAVEEELRQQFNELKRSNNNLKQSEDRLNRAQAIAHVGNWEYDVETEFVWGSEEAFRLFGIQRNSEFTQMEHLVSLVHIDDRNRVEIALKQLLRKNGKYDLEFRIIREDDKQERYLHSVAELILDEPGAPKKVLGVIQDITERKLAELKIKNSNEELSALYEELTASEEELRQQFDELQINREHLSISEEKYRSIVDNSDALIYSCNTDGSFTAVNKKICEVTGYSPENIIGKDMSFLVNSGKVNRQWKTVVKKVIKERKPVNFESNLKMPDESERQYYVTLSPVFDIHGNIISITGINHDITDKKKSLETIYNLAYYDALTNLPNRLLFTKKLNQAISSSKRSGSQLSVIFLDLDNFKKINDTMGHYIGDELLKDVSSKLQNVLGKNRVISRFSGDEFTIFIQNTNDVEVILEVTENIMRIFDDSFSINGNVMHITASIGISVYPHDGYNVDDLLRSADTAMYKAKELGKSNYQFYNQYMKDEVSKKVNIEKRLREAIKRNEFILYYQPQVEIKTGKIRGCEALIRWLDPEFGLISPAEFIPLAEETGLIVSIGEWVLRTACRKNKEWQEKNGFNAIISVNISAVQIRQKNFVDLVQGVLLETGLKPEFLELEITESVLIDSFDSTVSKLESLKKLGIKISLDDFGTGYSSLNYLKMLPIDTLKIDKTFVDDIKSGTVEKAIAGSIISLVHKLELEVIAEGIETKDQLDYLTQCNCDGVQGYLLSRPLKEESIPDILNKDYMK